MKLMLVCLLVMNNNYLGMGYFINVQVRMVDIRMIRKSNSDLEGKNLYFSSIINNKLEHNVFQNGKEMQKVTHMTCRRTDSSGEISLVPCIVKHIELRNHNNKHKEILKQPKGRVKNKIESAFLSSFKNHFIGRNFVSFVTHFIPACLHSVLNEDGLLDKYRNYFKNTLLFLYFNPEKQDYAVHHEIIPFMIVCLFFTYLNFFNKHRSKLQNHILESRTKFMECESAKSVNKCGVSNLKMLSAESVEETDDEEIMEKLGFIGNNPKLKLSFEETIFNTSQNRHLVFEVINTFGLASETLHTFVNKGQRASSSITKEESNLESELRKKERHSRIKKILEQLENLKTKKATEFHKNARNVKSRILKTSLSGRNKKSFHRRQSKRLIKKKKRNKKKTIIKNNKRKCVGFIPKSEVTGTNKKTNEIESTNKKVVKQPDTNKKKENSQQENYQRILSLVKNKCTVTQYKADERGCEVELDKSKSVSEKKIPDLLEIRGQTTASGHDALINEISERFNSNLGEKTIESVDKSDKKIIMVERETKKDLNTNQKKQNELCKEKESMSWLLNLEHNSRPFEVKPLFVYPISQYFERFATFSAWPVDSPVSAIRLCEAGFHYIGIGQVVECLTCKIQISEWNKGDIPLEIHQRLSPQCSFLISKEHVVEKNESNVPLVQIKPYTEKPSLYNTDTVEDGMPAGATGYSTDLISHFRTAMNISETPQPEVLGVNQETPAQTDNEIEFDITNCKNPYFATVKARLESFLSWQFHHKQDPRRLVDAGLYCIGRDDIVRCFCCDIGLADWESEDDPWTEHARHSPNCSYLIKERGQEFIDTIQESWRRIYSPKHPNLADYHTRLQTFATWPSDIEQRPRELCQAGFFYTEEEDVVRCHYCDGGLRQWEPGDDPWTEHARWFPFCKYIVKIKGLAFIENVSRHYNEMYNSSVPNDRSQTQDYSTVFIGDSVISTDSLQQDLESADPVGYVLSRGYSRENVRMAIQQFVHFNNGRNRGFTGTDLLNIIREREQLGDVIPEAISNPIIPGQSINNRPSKALAVLTSEQRKDEEQLDDHALAERNRQLKNQLVCITCQSRESTIVLTPCGHRVLCDFCSENLIHCPRCNVLIQHKIKSFLA